MRRDLGRSGKEFPMDVRYLLKNTWTGHNKIREAKGAFNCRCELLKTKGDSRNE